ncbi:MAG: T9SS type A sorting domain-containing protein [Bacteroidetes bacterium]|nr:T9SS type A sorting domain-containing protein [Bacteroidota bacterium]
MTASTDTAKAAQYNRIWKINRQEIEDFKTNFMNGTVQNGSFIPAEAILTWPTSDTGNYSRKMAPFVDANSDGIYNPITGGDYPLIRGDQMLYWVFNDNLGIHTESDGAQMKVEVHASAYAFNNPWLTTSDSLLNYTTFYHYEIFNRSSDALDSCYLANWTDFDLGNPNDDFFGTNVPRNTVYCYNSDSVDEGNGANHYGAHPPIISSIILNGPLAYLNDGIDNNNNGLIDETGENNRMTRSIFYKNDFSLSGNPVNTNHYYNYTAAHWKDNSPLTYGGNGFGGASPRKFIWPDYPTVPAGWHQSNASDGRMVQSCGPFHFAAGAKVDYDFAFIFSQDTSLTYNSAAYYNRAANDALTVENWFKQNSFPSTAVGQTEIKASIYMESKLLLFPNPTKAFLDLSLRNSSGLDKVIVLDILGNCLLTLDLSGVQKQTVRLNLQSYAPGIYFIEAQDKDGKSYCAKFVKDVN